MNQPRKLGESTMDDDIGEVPQQVDPGKTVTLDDGVTLSENGPGILVEDGPRFPGQVGAETAEYDRDWARHQAVRAAEATAPAAAGNPKPNARRRKPPVWAEDRAATVPKQDIREQLALCMPTVDVPDEIVDMIEGFYVNDTNEPDTDRDPHVASAKAGTELALWFLDNTLVPQTITFTALLGCDATVTKPKSADFVLISGNPWYDKMLQSNAALLQRVREELFDQWDELLAEGFIRFDSQDTLGGKADLNTEKGKITIQQEFLDASASILMARINRELFVPGENMLEAMKSAQYPGKTLLRNAYIAAGLDGSGEIVVMPLSALERFVIDWKREHNIRKK